MAVVAQKAIDQTIQDILKKLLVGYKPQEVILFGSYAYGSPQRDSDIDLLVIKDTNERFIDRWATARRLSWVNERTWMPCFHCARWNLPPARVPQWGMSMYRLPASRSARAS